MESVAFSVLQVGILKIFEEMTIFAHALEKKQ